ncbi:hypothetical protein [Microcoleus vaginatus]|uniref:hypothetical protein n=1 Tax=Microcoleus vaginatus TaxID=119532 RepID=UPI00020D1EF3|nr:hypothetical protein MicvaDRAFT_3928 [Microcoleus vaginatus FGP-2]
MPVPQENSSLVEWAGEPVLDNGARFKIKGTARHADAKEEKEEDAVIPSRSWRLRGSFK